MTTFFGQLASTTPAPARFAFETGAPLLPTVIVRRGFSGVHDLTIEPEVALETPFGEDLEANIHHNTERLNRIIERWIRAAPEQWLWHHRRWKIAQQLHLWQIPEHLRHYVSDEAPTPADDNPAPDAPSRSSPHPSP